MIEKNSEAMPVSAVSSEKILDENIFLDFINKKKKENKNGHGEDVNANILNVFSELYKNKQMSDGEVTSGISRHHKSVHQGLSILEIMSNLQKRQTILMAKSEMKESHVGHTVTTQLSNSRIPTANVAGKLIYAGDEETKDQSIETIKNHLIAVQLKSNLNSQHQELKLQNMKSREPQSSIVDRVLQANAGGLTQATGIQKQALNIDYPFLRWSGEHSVKVSIPAYSSHAGNLLLLPSDPRAAETLSRQINQLSGYTPELLNPEQDDEESKRRQSRQEREEDQE